MLRHYFLTRVNLPYGAMEVSIITKSQSVEGFKNSGRSTEAEFRRMRDIGTWHWSTKCSEWPKTDYFVNQSRPDLTQGELCGECERAEDIVTQ